MVVRARKTAQQRRNIGKWRYWWVFKKGVKWRLDCEDGSWAKTQRG